MSFQLITSILWFRFESCCSCFTFFSFSFHVCWWCFYFFHLVLCSVHLNQICSFVRTSLTSFDPFCGLLYFVCFRLCFVSCLMFVLFCISMHFRSPSVFLYIFSDVPSPLVFVNLLLTISLT